MKSLPTVGFRRIIEDEEKLMPSHLPPSLPHRGRELEALEVAFGSLKENPEGPGPVVLIKGKIGVGKPYFKTLCEKFY